MKFKLLVVRGEPRNKYLLFPTGEFMVGRGSECHIRPNSDWVSRQHCLLRITRAMAYVRDLGSTNGTLVNGVRVIGEQKLLDGDQVQVGPLVFEAHLEESILVSKVAQMELSGLPGEAGTPTEPTDELPSYNIDSQVATQDQTSLNGNHIPPPSPVSDVPAPAHPPAP
jgi:predicted component of type VI protein secretion system